MTWYFFTMTGKSKWSRHLAQHRAQVLEDLKPEFATILNINHPCDTDTLPENLFYTGDLYFDWDSSEADLQDLLDDVKRFMNQLEKWGFDLNQASWYLSGKKGIHCTIPMQCCFDERLCQSGVKDLFRVYGRFAWENATTYMDLRVYSGRKGRMWRTTYHSRIVNEKRTWKSPISPEQLRQLDADGYWAWCTAQREAITPAPATLNMHLATEMQVWLNRIAEETKSRVKSRPNPQIFAQWQGEKPPTIVAAFNGKNVNMERNLNDISLQLATAAIALGMNSEDKTADFLAACEGFIVARSQLTGTTHHTRSQISDRLKKAFHYCLGNSNYTYIPEVFASILTAESQQALDLKGIQSGASEEKLKAVQSQLQADIAVDDVAIYRESRKNIQAIADYSWQKGSLRVVRDSNGIITHYSVVAQVGGKLMPRRVLPISTLYSIREFSEYLGGYGATTTLGSNAQLASARKALLNFVGDEDKELEEITVTRAEGMVLVLTSDPEDGKYQGATYWVEPNQTSCSQVNYDSNLPVPQFLDTTNPTGSYGIDLSQAYNIRDYLHDAKQVVHHLLNLNGDFYSLAVMISWFSACYIKHHLYVLQRIKTFPLLQIVGQAGCGKTTTANIFLNLFTWRKTYRINIAGRNLTTFAISSLASGSTSVPLVIDEVKPQNLGLQYMAEFRGFLQTIYTIGSEAKRGGGDGTSSSSYRTISKEPMTAPVCFLAEALEASQASIIERSVVAAFHKDATNGRSEHARYLGQHERNLGMLGWYFAQEALDINLDTLVKLHDQSYTDADSMLVNSNNHRVVENAAMMLTGFKFFANCIKKLFSEQFDDKLEALQHALMQPVRWQTQVASEVAKMLSLLSSMSYTAEMGKLRTVLGLHYAFEGGIGGRTETRFLVLHIEKCFYLYRERMRELGMTPAFTSVEEYKFALINSAITVDNYYDRTLKGWVVKLDQDSMVADGIELFNANN